MNGNTLTPKKKTPPPVRVTYSLTKANGDKLKTQSGDFLTVKY